MASSEGTARSLRADAQANHDRLLEVAARAFAEDGAEASLKAIAKEAGVGTGTLYRRFPTREILVEATYRGESARLCASAGDLLRHMPAIDALRVWMERFLDHLATKRGMAESLRAVLTNDDDLRLKTRGMLIDALALLLREGEEQGAVRSGLDPSDVVMALGGIALIASDQDQRDLAGRLLDLLMAGLTASAGE
ncbi:TetR/AcrR family transcriptional regulator [Actinoallomurus sp. NBC_01490]|uniref:TetR/AcrR family transcriptional regulator n=1 Tax=Actinoallomurus sp. NBC_01490 TaxID=2903557 RepID=UPI002E31964E|nr:helix-turn-helix domain-containing protein [Actinoallomurus sp. NBC_01490]